MDLRVGDIVKFLNEKGGGQVTAIVDTHMVKIMTEDGFEVPVLKRELIKIPSETKESENTSLPAPEAPELFAKQIPRPDRTNEASGIYLAWVQVPGSQIIGEVDLALINHTKHDILFNILSESNERQIGFEYGSLAPGSSVIVQQYPGNANEVLLKGEVQVLFHPLEAAESVNPLTASFKVKAMRLLKDDSYRITPFFTQPAMMIYLGNSGQAEVTEKKQTLEVAKGQSFIEKHLKGEKEAVVDLHLDKILDNVKGITPAEALQIQMNYFERILSSAITREIETVVFIHGVGNGILKSEIRKKLQSLENVLYFDAPLSQYGIGATEVKVN